MTPEQNNLLTQARDAAKKAYAPYSKFRVGAAVLTGGGIFKGANIENASSNLGICAERVAIAHARMNNCRDIIGIAVCCEDTPKDDGGQAKPEMTMPCGGCRQWMAELAPDAWVVTNGSEREFRVVDLLPDPFVFQE